MWKFSLWLWNLVNTVVIDVYNSFNTEKKGMSFRKLAAFTIIWFALKIAAAHTTPENLSEVLIVLLCFASLCIGLVTVADLIRFKGNKEDVQPQQQQDQSQQQVGNVSNL